jgi:hypothetical protein
MMQIRSAAVEYPADPGAGAGTTSPCAAPGTASGDLRSPPGKRWRDADGEHIDVRGLAPPGPLVAIVRLIESVADATPVIVHHDRDPVLLYPELAERGWVAETIAGEAGEVRLKLQKG